MNNDLFLYQTWIEYLYQKQTNTYCMVVEKKQTAYPLCSRHMKNLRCVDSFELIEKIYNCFPIKFTTQRSVYAQKREWGNLSDFEALTFITDGQTWEYIFIIGIDKNSNNLICFDSFAREHKPSLLYKMSMEKGCHLFGCNRDAYVVEPHSLEKLLFAVLIETKHIGKFRYEVDVLYDEIAYLDTIKNRKGLSLYETWFTQTIIMNQPIRCVVNSEKYEIEDLLLAYPEYQKSFNEKIIYSSGEDISTLIFQYWTETENVSNTMDITVLVMDAKIAHAVTVIGVDLEKDFILYFDSEQNTLLTPEHMPVLKQGGFAYNNVYAISRTEFIKIVYAIMLPELVRA